MDRTDRDRDSSEDGSLDETVPSEELGPSTLTRTTGQAEVAEPPIERGTEIGRYVAIEHIGSGTMGLVVSAFDPTLDRKVAIKLVRLDPTGTTSGRQRLMREAQAMAKLQHPNVVTVFEVGTFRDQVFLAMEYVAGSTLAAWLAQHGRTRHEIVAAFIAAGHGLAAAHRAGIVHRDFKPTNVLVAKDGRVRVADFGLATAPTDAAPPPVAIRDSDPGPLEMTKTGAVLGTPAYMSPEQHRGEPADARADQYAFCAALYEALYGELPFEGKAFLVYRDNVLAGRIRETPRGSDVPPRIRRVLLRGLALAPADRYPDLDALLAELSHDPAASRRRLALVGGAAVVVAGAIAFGVLSGSRDEDPCAAAERPLEGMWNATRRSELETSFLASRSPGAASAFERVSRELDQRAAALRAARRDACEATAVRREQSPELLDRRIQCVDQRAAATSALIAVLTEHHETDALMKGIDAVMSLPPLEPCADRAALLADAPPPAPAIRAQVEALAHRLDRVEAMSDAGMWTKSLDELAKITHEADSLDHTPLRARARFLAADAHVQLEHNERAIAEFRRAGELAAAAHDDKLVARSWIGLYATVGYRMGNHDEARGLEPATAAAVVRAGNDPGLRGHLENARGLVELGRDRYLAAAQHFQAAAREHTAAGRSKLSKVASSLGNAGTALTYAERYDEARAEHERALAIRIETLGLEHPSVASSYYGLGVLFDTMGQPEQALESFRKSAAITAKVYPPDNAHIAKSLVSIGLVLGELERREEALDHQERAVAIFELHPEDNRRNMSTALYNLGLAYLSVDRTKEALSTFQRALDIAQAEHGAESYEVASLLAGMLVAADASGDHVRAKEYGLRALAIREKTLGPDHQQVGRVLGDLAQNANARNEPREAMQLITRALAIIDKPGAPPLAVKFVMLQIRATAELALSRADAALADARASRDGLIESGQPAAAAEVQLTVADALWMQGGVQQRRAAVTEVKTALDTLQAQPKPDAKLLAKARAWLAQHAAP